MNRGGGIDMEWVSFSKNEFGLMNITFENTALEMGIESIK